MVSDLGYYFNKGKRDGRKDKYDNPKKFDYDLMWKIIIDYGEIGFDVSKQERARDRLKEAVDAYDEGYKEGKEGG